jgi:hypothetical protein
MVDSLMVPVRIKQPIYAMAVLRIGLFLEKIRRGLGRWFVIKLFPRPFSVKIKVGEGPWKCVGADVIEELE